MIWNPKIETMSRPGMKQLQLDKLKKTVLWAYERVPMYKERFDSIGLKPEHIKTFDDVKYIPFTVKDDLRDHYPYGLFAVPMKEIVRIHASSGTTGKPTVVGYTREDIAMWAEATARIATAGGATEDDIAQISFGYGLFTGALGLHYGLEKIGASVIPVSSGNTERQVMLMRDFGSTLLVSTPSYAMYMSEIAEKLDIMKDIHIKWALIGSEGSTDEMRLELERRWGCTATDNYGLSEIIGPGVSGECLYKNGQHINEDLFYCEIVDPATGDVLPTGEIGEMVITPIQKLGLPLLRYRTHDITQFIEGDCPCGRTTLRMKKIMGRSDDMLKIRGVNVYPSQIESVLMGIEGIGPHYEIIVTRDGYLDKIEIVCELTDPSVLDIYRELEKLQKRIKEKIKVILQLDAEVRLVSPNMLKRFEGKAHRVTDLRDKK